MEKQQTAVCNLPSKMSSFKNRTGEFHAFAQRLQQQKALAPPPPRKKHARTSFIIAAAEIGKGISETANKLSKLSRLARKKTLFDDPVVEIDELTYIVKKDIHKLNSQITALKNQANRQNKQAEKHSGNIVNTLKMKLADATKDFQHVLETRTENLKEQHKHKMELTGKTISHVHIMNEPLFSEESLQSNTSGDVAITFAPQQTIEHDYSTRVHVAQNIEKTMVELQGIFTTLASLVAEQGEMIERIEDDVSATVSNVHTAQDELMKYLSKVSSNRWLIMKIFMVLVIFIILFVVFFV